MHPKCPQPWIHVCAGGGCSFGYLEPVTAGQEFTGDISIGPEYDQIQELQLGRSNHTAAETHSQEQGARDRRSWERGNRNMKSLIWATKAEGWWPTKGLSGVDVAYTEEEKALARWQDFVPPEKTCSGLSLDPHLEHMSPTRDSCASLITVLLWKNQAEGGKPSVPRPWGGPGHSSAFLEEKMG